MMDFKDALTALVAIAVVWLGHRFTTQRSVADQLWDLRRGTYSFILANLSAMEHTVAAIDKFVARQGWEDSEYLAKQDNALWEAYRAVCFRFHDDYLIASPRFRDVMSQFEAAGRWTGDDDDYDAAFINSEMHRSLSKAVKKYRPQLLALAIEELEGLRRGIVETCWHNLKTGNRPSAG